MPRKPRPAFRIDRSAPPVACSSCSLRELCLPGVIEPREMERIDRLVNHRRKLKRGEHLYRAGARLSSLYAIRSGTMKSCVVHEDGREQVAGFHMTGDLLGMDAIGGRRHTCDTVALEDCEGPEAAARCYEQALALDADFADAHFNLAGLCEQLGRPADALRHYRAYKDLAGA